MCCKQGLTPRQRGQDGLMLAPMFLSLLTKLPPALKDESPVKLPVQEISRFPDARRGRKRNCSLPGNRFGAFLVVRCQQAAVRIRACRGQTKSKTGASFG